MEEFYLKPKFQSFQNSLEVIPRAVVLNDLLLRNIDKRKIPPRTIPGGQVPNMKSVFRTPLDDCDVSR